MDFVFEDAFQDLSQAAAVTADTIYQQVRHCQTRTLVVHGAKSQDPKDVDGHQMLTEGTELELEPDRSESFILEGLTNNRVVFTTKLNHLLIRDCHNSTIKLESGTISGLDILHSDGLVVETSFHNYTNVELSHTSQLHGELDDSSRIIVRRVWDLSLNGHPLSVTPFESVVFTAEGRYLEPSSPPPHMTLSSTLYQPPFKAWY